MTDNRQRDSISIDTIYTQVKPHQLSPHKRSNPYESYSSMTKSSTIEDLHRRSKLTFEMLSKIESIQANERVLAAIEYGKGMILDAIGKNTPEYRKKMGVIFLSVESGKKYLGPEYLGAYIPGVDAVYTVISDNYTDMFIASNAFHELVHRWLEPKEVIYRDSQDEDSNIRSSYFELGRTGLKVRKVKKDPETGDVSEIEYTGHFLNELGNYAMQSVFLHNLINDSKINGLFSDEIEAREKMLEKRYPQYKRGFTIFDVTDEHGIDHKVAIGSQNIHFYDGSLTSVNANLSTSIMLQIVDELEEIVGNVNGGNFKNILAYFKVHPEEQKYLRRLLDDKLGDGFYKKLKNLDMESYSAVIDLLSELQHKAQELRDKSV